MCVVGLARDAEPAAERLHAVVVPDADVLQQRRVVNARELVRFELENYSVALPHHKRVLGFELWTDDLPRTTTRKLKRFEIERRLRRQQADERARTGAAGPSAEDAAWAAEPAVEAVLRVVREAARDAPLRRDANLELDLGLDSMERVELLTLLQQRLGTTLDEEAAQQIVTLADLARAFASAGRAAPVVAGGDAWEQVLGAAPPADEYLAELDHPKPATAFVMWSALRVVAGLARLLLGFRVHGREHLPAVGPCLVCPNHESYLDGFLLCAALPSRTLRRIFFVGASEYFTTPLMRRLARAWNIVPVDPDANLVRAMQVGAYGLRRGKILILFPEGERSIDGEVKTFRKGATILATRLGVPVVPAAFGGLFDVWPRSRPFNWRALLPSSNTSTVSPGPARTRSTAMSYLASAPPCGCRRSTSISL